ncbi:MAG: hypothetical protein PHO94_08685 [Petrimonas sp.]|nr:hypothetical protein [Petrimonas sp.]
MKKALNTFIALLLASVVAYGGSGVNVYFFCCDECSSEGISAIIDHKCCEVHHHHHLGGLITHYDDHQCMQHWSEGADECGVERIPVLWDSFSDQTNYIQPIFFDLDNALFQTCNNEIEAIPSSDVYTAYHTQKPPNLSKKDYFSLLTTLII